MKPSSRRLPLVAPVSIKSCANGTFDLRLQAAANSNACHLHFWHLQTGNAGWGAPYSVGQASARQTRQSRKSAQRLLSIPHLMVSRAFASDFDQRRLAFINPKMGCTLQDWIRCGRQIQVALRKNKNDINSSCRFGYAPVLSVSRRRGETSNRGCRLTIVFDAAFCRRANRWCRISTSGTSPLSIQRKWDALCWIG